MAGLTPRAAAVWSVVARDREEPRIQPAKEGQFSTGADTRRRQWTLRDVTGNPALESKLSQRLVEDGIPEGSDVIRVRGAGSNASAIL